MKLTDDVKQRKQKHFKQYRTAKQKLTNKENLVRFLHRGKPRNLLGDHDPSTADDVFGLCQRQPRSQCSSPQKLREFVTSGVI